MSVPCRWWSVEVAGCCGLAAGQQTVHMLQGGSVAQDYIDTGWTQTRDPIATLVVAVHGGQLPAA